ncbi:MAG: phosphomannomutase [Desulfopila sp.]
MGKNDTLPCFKSYDIRGRVPEELDDDLAYKIGQAFSHVKGVKKVAVGHDIRLSSERLCKALTAGLCAGGTHVLQLGLCATEEVYHAAFSLETDGVDGGVMITASHNPADYNGMKFVSRGGRSVAGSSGLQRMAELIGGAMLPSPVKHRGQVEVATGKGGYIDHLLSYVDGMQLSPLQLVVNSGNGCAGPLIDLLAERLPFEFVRLNHQPDGTFPHGVPNPLLAENQAETAAAVQLHGADLGIAWDGDGDRCFFWDENGTFIDGYYIVGLLALEMLQHEPGGKILYDPRLTWNTEELVGEVGGRAVMTESGHALIKERMRRENAVYGGETTAHHYFRKFGYCDSGMIPWLLLCAVLSRTGQSLSQIVGERMQRFPVSGEINSTVADPDAIIARIERQFPDGEKRYLDGLSVSYPEYRFSIRKSNTEPLLRLNVETRANRMLLQQKTEELLALIRCWDNEKCNKQL